MANLYENIPEMQARAQANEQRRRIAEAMLAQSQEQVQPFVNTGRLVAPMSWTQGLAQMVKAYGAGQGLRKTDEADAQLAKEHAAKAAEALAAYRTQSQGAPERAPAPIAPLNGNGPPRPAPGPPVPAVAADPRGAIQALLANQYAPPEAKQAAIMGENWRREDADIASKALERKEALELKAQELQDKRAKAIQDSEDKRYTVDQNNAARREAAALTYQLGLLTKAAQDGAKFQSTDNAGNVTFYDRAGNPVAKHEGAGKPSASFEQAAASKKKMERDLDTAISEFEKITKPGGLIEQATGSGIGKGVDWTASLVGHATPGAVAIGKLKPIFDLGLKMVPRFEGPQSDKDTQSYRDAAGDIANPAIPAPQKLESAKVMLELMKTRRGQFSMEGDVGGSAAPAAPAAPTGGTVLKFDAQGNPVQ
jgi:hypothetical protein